MAGLSIKTTFSAIDKITGPTRTMMGQVDKFSSGASKGIDKIGSSWRGLNRLIQGTIGFMAGSAVIRFAGSFVTAAADVEKYKTQLKVMLGSQEAANARFEEMSAFAARTPFELNEVVDLGNQLQALGRYSVDNMGLLGDLAAAAGKPIDQVVDAFAKLSSGQKGRAVEMFRNLLITTNDWVTATGKGVTKSGEMMATTEQMLAALPEIMRKKGFFGMMAQQAQTWNGQVSNFKDNLTRIKAQLGEAMMGPLKKILERLSGLAEKALAWVQANKDLIATKLDKFLSDAVEFIERLFKTYNALNDLFGGHLIGTVIGFTVAWKGLRIAIEAATAAQKVFALASGAGAAAGAAGSAGTVAAAAAGGAGISGGIVAASLVPAVATLAAMTYGAAKYAQNPTMEGLNPAAAGLSPAARKEVGNNPAASYLTSILTPALVGAMNKTAEKKEPQRVVIDFANMPSGVSVRSSGSSPALTLNLGSVMGAR